MKLYTNVIALLSGALISSVAVADEKPYQELRALSSAIANKAVTVAEVECAKSGYQVAVALVDRGGNLQAFLRNPRAGSHTVEVSLAKAKTSASFKTSTMDLMTNPRLAHLKYAPGVLLLGGGVPVEVGGHFYGAIGVSGAPAEKVAGDTDDACARAGIDAIREDIEFSE
jgi:uncharacterized protein GlcG (DUF336 family)